jgi:hypothetical protein
VLQDDDDDSWDGPEQVLRRCDFVSRLSAGRRDDFSRLGLDIVQNRCLPTPTRARPREVLVAGRGAHVRGRRKVARAVAAHSVIERRREARQAEAIRASESAIDFEHYVSATRFRDYLAVQGKQVPHCLDRLPFSPVRQTEQQVLGKQEAAPDVPIVT